MVRLFNETDRRLVSAKRLGYETIRESEMSGRSGASVPKNAQTIESDDAVDQRLGETVRLLRQRAGFSIQDVANRTGLSTGMISQLERARAMPSVRTLQ